MASNFAQPSYSQWLRENPDVMAAVPAPAPQAPATTYSKWTDSAPAAPPAQQQPSQQQGATSTTITVQTSPQTPAYQAPAAPQPVVAPATRNPTRALAEVQKQQIEGMNQIGASFLREGETKAEAGKKKVAELGSHVALARRYADAADKTHDDNLIQQNEMKAWMQEDLRKLREPPQEPERWKKTVGVLSGIVLGTAAGYLGRLGGGISYGMNALNDWVYKSVNEQLDEQDQADKNLERTDKAFRTLSEDSANETDIGHKLVANHWLAASAELERIGEESKVPEYRENAFRLATEARGKGLGILETNYRQQIADARAAAAARAKALAAGPKWENMDPAVLEALEREGKLPLAGLNALNDARKKAREAAGTDDPKGIVQNPQIEGLTAIPGATITKDSFSEAQKAKRMMDKVAQHLTRAKELATVDTSLYPYDNDRLKVEGQYAGQRASALALMSQLVEAGVLNEGDAERFGAGLPEPDSVFRNDMSPEAKAAVYDEMLNNFRITGEDGLRTLGFELQKASFTPDEPPPGPMSAPPTQAPAPSGPATPPKQQRVTMFGPDGNAIDVKPALVPAFRDQGFTTEPPMSPPPPLSPSAAPPAPDKRPEDMTDQEYAAYVLAQNGY